MNVLVELPPEALEQLAARAAELALEQLQTMSAEPEFLTVEEAATMLRAKRQRVYDLLSAGRLRRYKDGARVLIRRAEVLDHLAGDVAVESRRRAA